MLHGQVSMDGGVMDHFWQSIPNYTSTPDYFAWLAEKATERQWKTIVLVGIYQGASAACLAVELYNRQAPTRIDLVDWWQASKKSDAILHVAPVATYIGQWRDGLSWDQAAHYADESIDAVFIDADHRYAGVRADIESWLPKVQKRNGVLSGHDYCPFDVSGYKFGVIEAVKEFALQAHPGFRVWQGIEHCGQLWPTWSVDYGS